MQGRPKSKLQRPLARSAGRRRGKNEDDEYLPARSFPCFLFGVQLTQAVGSRGTGSDKPFCWAATPDELCRAAVETCLVTGGRIGENGELDHPVRGDRPPILLSKQGDALIEDQVGNLRQSPVDRALRARGQTRSRSGRRHF